jgi:5-methyltetrahydrofolate--homocysteine methyltransferase
MTEALDDRLDAIFQAVLDYKGELVAALVARELAHGTDAQAIINDALIAAMDEVGDQFATGRVFVPEMLAAANAMKAGLTVLRPHMTGQAAKPVGKLVIGSVHRDLHDIGKNLVAMIMEGAGFEVVDLGISVAPDDFVAAVRQHRPDLVGLSALLTTTMPNMRKTVEVLRRAGFHGAILVGGAPVNQAFATDIGATGYAGDAPAAVEIARRLMREARAAP